MLGQGTRPLQRLYLLPVSIMIPMPMMMMMMMMPMPTPMICVVAVGREVVVAVAVAEVVFVYLGTAEAYVWLLKITGPSSTKNGDMLPFVRLAQLLVDGSAWPQQKRLCLFSTYRG